MLADPLLPGVEVLQAHYTRYRYAPHWHDAACVAVVGTGAAAFDCRRARHLAPAGSVFVIPAYEVHTGEPAADAGLGYQVLYIAPGSLAGVLGDGGAAEPHLVSPSGDLVRYDSAAAGPLRRFHQAMAGPASPLERQHALMTAALAVAAEYGRGPRPRCASPREHRAVQRARDYLRAHSADAVTLGDLAEVSGLSMYRLAHTFKAETAWRAAPLPVTAPRAARQAAAGRRARHRRDGGTVRVLRPGPPHKPVQTPCGRHPGRVRARHRRPGPLLLDPADRHQRTRGLAYLRRAEIGSRAVRTPLRAWAGGQGLPGRGHVPAGSEREAGRSVPDRSDGPGVVPILFLYQSHRHDHEAAALTSAHPVTEGP